MLRKLILMLAVLVAFASATVSAQTSRSVSAPMTLTLAPFLSCVVDGGISYGTVTRSAGTVSTSSSNFAQFTCDADPGATLSYTFTLPASMTNPAATGLPVPLSFGSTSAFVNCNGTVFNPATGLANDICPGGHVVIQLGVPKGNGASDLVTANVSNASPAGGGQYSAVIVINVTSQ
jgi:hypothetical protein